MDKIYIKDLEVYANHGVQKEENTLKQKFLISATLYTSVRNAGLKDCLENTINYYDVCHSISIFVCENTFHLIETLAEQIAERLLIHVPNLSAIDIEVKKPWAPIGLPLDTVSVAITRSWHESYIALGSNIGDRESYFKSAIAAMDCNEKCIVEQVSPFIITKPYGSVQQEDFLNACLRLRTLYTPHELLEYLNTLETEANRTRDVRWGPRTLDLDIIFYDNIILRDDVLCIPHIEMHKRPFVLAPLSKIAPYKIHPVYNQTITELLYGVQEKDFDEENEISI